MASPVGRCAYVVATCDTKGAEAAYIRDLIAGTGVPVRLVDVGLMSDGAGADVAPRAVADHHPEGADAVLGTGDRGAGVAAMAEAFSVAVSPHNYNSTTLGFAAMLHCAAVLPNLLTAELYPDFLAAGAAIAETDFEIAGGAAGLPQAPGLSVTMKEDVLAELAAKSKCPS